MTADQATATVTRTWTGTVRLRNAREHNRRGFLRHGTDWTPDDFASVLDDAAGRIVAREAREHRAPDGFDATRFGRRVVGGWSAVSLTISQGATPGRARRRRSSDPGGRCTRSG